jgi:hypothetical protein
MSNVNTDAVTLSVTDEDPGPPFGVLTGTPIWFQLEPNGASKFGPEVKTVARTPISKNLQRLKGKVTELDSGVTFAHDLTFELLHRMLPNALFAQFANTPTKGPQNGAPFYPTGVTATEYTVPALGDVPNGTILWASGFGVAGNNGKKVAAGGSTGVALKAAGLAIEAVTVPDQNASVYVCGVVGAASDISIDVTAGVVTLESAVLDFTSLGWNEGQFIRVGGTDAGTFFATAGDNGYARIAKGGLSAHACVLDKWATTPVTDAGTGKTIELYFGPFIHNVPIDSSLYYFRTMMVEETLPELGGTGVPEFWYAEGNLVDEMALNFPLANKGDAVFTLKGTNSFPPDTSRETGADHARVAVLNDAFNTSSEMLRLRSTLLDETGITADFLSANLTIKNNVSPKKVLGTLGAKYMNRGYIEVELDSEILFTTDDVPGVIRANTTVTAELGFLSSEGQGFFVDFPAATMGDGAQNLPAHDQVALKLKLSAHKSTVYGTSVSFSMFPFAPA